MIRVVVADDQGLVRAGLCSILATQADIDVVAEARDGEEAVRVVREAEPDVVHMDVRMPGTDGIDAATRLAHGSWRILMLTTFDMDEYVYAAMKAGASGFLLKNAPPESLVDAVRAAARGDALLAPAITRRLVEEFVRRPAPGITTPEALAPLIRASGTSSRRWRAAGLTPRSPDGCSCPRRPSRRM